jgi:uncharacterized membrane protein
MDKYIFDESNGLWYAPQGDFLSVTYLFYESCCFLYRDDESRLQMMQRVLKGRMLPLLIIFFLVLLPQFLTNLCDTRNYSIPAFTGGVLTMYLVIFIIFFVKYIQYKSSRK